MSDFLDWLFDPYADLETLYHPTPEQMADIKVVRDAPEPDENSVAHRSGDAV